MWKDIFTTVNLEITHAHTYRGEVTSVWKGIFTAAKPEKAHAYTCREEATSVWWEDVFIVAEPEKSYRGEFLSEIIQVASCTACSAIHADKRLKCENRGCHR